MNDESRASLHYVYRAEVGRGRVVLHGHELLQEIILGPECAGDHLLRNRFLVKNGSNAVLLNGSCSVGM